MSGVATQPSRTCRCGGTITTHAKKGMRGYRVDRCDGPCGWESMPRPAAVDRKQQQLARHAARIIEGPFAPSVPAPRGRTPWSPDEAIPRGERD